MTITPVNGTRHQFAPEAAESRSLTSLVKRLETHLNHQETAYGRLKRIRKQAKEPNTTVHTIDDWLANPQRFKSRGLRGLIYLSQYLEEIAEACADLSGVAERFVRSVISSGEKSDIPYILASGVGRVVAAQLNLLGVAMHKAIGGGFYALSVLLSLGIVAIIKTGLPKQRSEVEFKRALQRPHVGYSLGKRLADAMLQVKEKILKKAVKHTENNSTSLVRKSGRVIKYLSARHSTYQAHEVWKRRTHSAYIWNNMHQYSALTRGLMTAANGLFQGVNRLSVSFDKHIGILIGSTPLRKKTGDLLACRIGLLIAVGGAVGISIPLSPFLVGIWTAGAIACGASILLIILAKANIILNHDWRGNINPPRKVMFSAG